MDLMDYRRKIIANSPHLKSASGAVATFSDGEDLPLKSLNVNIEPVQSGTGDPSPTNVRPISGWNGVKVTRAGKNLSPINANNVSPRNYWGTNWTELIAVLNTLPVGVYTISNKFTVVTLPNSGQVAHGRIYITAMVNGTQRTLTSYSVTNDTSPTVGKAYQESGTFTITEEIRGNINHAYLYCDSTDHSGSTSTGKGTYSLTDVQIELGSTATPYEPYNGVNVSIDLGQTVYGGTLNVLTGVLTAYPYYASYNGETLTGRWVSDRNKYVAGTTPTIGAQVVDMSGTGTEIQLTPHQIRSLYGNNTIFADTGNVALEYWAHA